MFGSFLSFFLIYTIEKKGDIGSKERRRTAASIAAISSVGLLEGKAASALLFTNCTFFFSSDAAKTQIACLECLFFDLL
jgi:hypothetical protein